MDDKKDIKEPFKEIPDTEKVSEVFSQELESAEKKETPERDDFQQLKDSVEKMDLSDDLKKQANVTAQSIKSLDLEKKMKQLLELAKQKGVIYAVHVAKNMDDPYVLDMLHDMLAQDGLYKSFLK